MEKDWPKLEKQRTEQRIVDRNRDVKMRNSYGILQGHVARKMGCKNKFIAKPKGQPNLVNRDGQKASGKPLLPGST